MTEDVDAKPGVPSTRRRTILIVVAAVAVAAVIAVIVAVSLTRGTTPSADPSSSANPSSSTSPSVSPSATPAPSSTPTPSASSGSEAFPELPPVQPNEPVETESATVQISTIEHVDGEAIAPGDVAGPAIRLTIDFTNTGTQPLDLGLVVVNGYMGAALDPAEPFTKPGGSPVSGSLAPGAKATGVYLFRVPLDRQNDVTIVVDYLPGQPSVVFKGSFA